MKALSRRRRHPGATYVLLLLALLATGGIYTAITATGSASAASGSSATASVADGQALFAVNCSSCHGINAQGTSRGPSLVGVGAAAVDFQVGTGRMPAADVGPQVPARKVRFTQAQIDDLAAYVASLGPGPEIPTAANLDTTGADVAMGGEIFRTNCSMCHNFAGSGGALSNGKFAPSLKSVAPKYIWEAMVTGPASMPKFSNGTLTPQDKQDVIAWLTQVRSEGNPGGFGLGQIGPVSEGLVVWVVGLGALIGCAVWLGAKAK